MPIELMGWRNRVRDARACGAFSDEDQYDAISWDTCAVGEALLIRTNAEDDFSDDEEAYALLISGTGRGERLRKLGADFNQAIERDDIDGAEKLLSKIEVAAMQWTQGLRR